MTAFIFDLDGTLIDSVYAHVLAWQQALDEAGLAVDAWRIHRRMGLSGPLVLHALRQELGCEVPTDRIRELSRRHGELFHRSPHHHRPVRGAKELLSHLRARGIPFGIATSGNRPGLDPALRSLGIDHQTVVVEGRGVEHAKPEPDELIRCQQQLGVEPRDCFVVGDAIWDLLAAGRAGMFSIGLLSGGGGAQELFNAGAHRVFLDAAELKDSLYQLGLD